MLFSFCEDGEYIEGFASEVTEFFFEMDVLVGEGFELFFGISLPGAGRDEFMNGDASCEEELGVDESDEDGGTLKFCGDEESESHGDDGVEEIKEEVCHDICAYEIFLNGVLDFDCGGGLA
jgi:hypothetical protein